jgi:hypothetical protein
MDGSTMPKGKQPQLILTEVGGIDPGVAALLADGTPYGFYSAIINRMIDRTNICASRKLLGVSDYV